MHRWYSRSVSDIILTHSIWVSAYTLISWCAAAGAVRGAGAEVSVLTHSVIRAWWRKTLIILITLLTHLTCKHKIEQTIHTSEQDMMERWILYPSQLSNHTEMHVYVQCIDMVTCTQPKYECKKVESGCACCNQHIHLVSSAMNVSCWQRWQNDRKQHTMFYSSKNTNRLQISGKSLNQQWSAISITTGIDNLSPFHQWILFQ